MSYILSRKYARKDDSDFVIAAARAFYCDWYLSDEKRERAVARPGAELTDAIPETQRWAFALARDFVEMIRAKESAQGRAYCFDEILAGWLATWDEKGDREPTEENAGWYAAMQAMGHGVGLQDAGCLDIELPHIEAYP